MFILGDCIQESVFLSCVLKVLVALQAKHCICRYTYKQMYILGIWLLADTVIACTSGITRIDMSLTGGGLSGVHHKLTINPRKEGRVCNYTNI